MAPQVGILELLSPEGKPVTREGEKGEIVVTGFNNRIFPIIRYCTGDIATFTLQECQCDRQYPLLIEIEGRIQDYVVNKNGNVVPFTPAVFNYNDVDWSNVHRFQAIQESEGNLLFNLMLKNPVNEQEISQRIAKQLYSVLPEGFNLSIQCVDEIKRTERGKYRYLIQHLDLRKYYS